MPPPFRLTAFALLTGLFVGCGGSDPMTAASVKGKVLMADGRPLTTGTVRFVPDKDKGNTAGAEPVAQIGATGEYELVTQGNPGAPLGWFKVAVVATEPMDPSKPAAVPKSLIARRFADPVSSGLSVEVVKSAKDGAYDLKVSAK